jgi:FtsZ-binding cell division protein ZapB
MAARCAWPALCVNLGGSLSRSSDVLEPVPDIQNEEPVDAAPAQPSRANAELRPPALPPAFKPDDLPRSLRGYDRYSTEKRFAALGQLYQKLWQDSAETIRDLELEIDRLDEGKRLIGETLVSAQQEAQTVRENARREAEALLKAARTEADQLREETELEATAKAKELVETAERERAILLEEAGRAKAFVEETHGQLSEFLLAAVKWYEEANLGRDGEPETSGEPTGEELAEPVEGQELDSPGLNGSPDLRIA